MRSLTLGAIYLALSSVPAFAGQFENNPNPPSIPAPHFHPTPAPQPAGNSNATATATGVGIANSSSQAGAVAISGQGGQGGQGGAGGHASSRSNASGGTALAAGGNVNIAGTPAVTTQNIHQSGGVSSVPAVFAPGLSAAGIESCLGSVSMGASWLGTGLTGGGSIPDESCSARLDARTLWSFGLRRAALARVCLQPNIYRSMPEVCAVYLPVQTSYGVVPVAVRPQEAPVVRALASAGDYTGGSIMLVDGKTGKEHLCNNYAASRQKCLQWDDQPSISRVAHRSTKQRTSIASKKPATTAPVVAAGTTAQATAAAESTKKE